MNLQFTLQRFRTKIFMKNQKRILSILLVLFLCIQLCAVSISAYAVTRPTVRTGSTGTHVKTLQTMLNELNNAKLDADGIFGPATLTAVKKFQSQNKLGVDGIVGPATWGALDEKYEKSKEPANTMTVSSGKFPSGALTKGSPFSIRGVITSNYNITSVTAGIYSSDGKTAVMTKTVKPNYTKSDLIYVDSALKFGNLSVGSYCFKVTATDASGVTATLVNNAFTVAAAVSQKPTEPTPTVPAPTEPPKQEAAPAASTLAIASGRYNPNILAVGQSYSISGNITSNYKITSVTVGVYTNKGVATGNVKTFTPNATSFNISSADSQIVFGSLASGSYIFRVSATDASGKTKTLVDNAFLVTKTSIYSVKADGSKMLSKGFSVSDFRCQDGSDTVLVDVKLVEYLQAIEDHFGKEVKINSGFRTISHNKSVGGASNSMHLYGSAADIRIPGISPTEIARYAERIGIKGIGLYSSFVHVDTRTAKCFWEGYEEKIVSSFLPAAVSVTALDELDNP